MEKEKNFELDVITRLTKIETMLEDFKGIEAKSTDAYNLSTKNKEKIEDIEAKLKELDENKKWLFRTSIGALIGAIISSIVGVVVALVK